MLPPRLARAECGLGTPVAREKRTRSRSAHWRLAPRTIRPRISRRICETAGRAEMMMLSPPRLLRSDGRQCSFDHLVGASKQDPRRGQAKFLRGLQVDDELELRRRLHWQIGRFGAAKDTIDIGGRAAVQINQVGAI